ncbi:hypothetical protein TUSST3_37960 [Streptomyces sp. TUS-ST3]|nr:hypothetical protein TUSST3_37960 [Streptomyces sp. TUS-ST3]
MIGDAATGQPRWSNPLDPVSTPVTANGLVFAADDAAMCGRYTGDRRILKAEEDRHDRLPRPPVTSVRQHRVGTNSGERADSCRCRRGGEEHTGARVRHALCPALDVTERAR